MSTQHHLSTRADGIVTAVLNPEPASSGRDVRRTDSIDKEFSTHLEKSDIDVDAERHEDHGPVDQFGGEIKLSKEEQALVRKLDFRIMPILWASESKAAL